MPMAPQVPYSIQVLRFSLSYTSGIDCGPCHPPCINETYLEVNKRCMSHYVVMDYSVFILTLLS